MCEKEEEDLRNKIEAFMQRAEEIKKKNETIFSEKISYLEKYLESKIKKNFFKKIFSSESKLHEALYETIIPKMNDEFAHRKRQGYPLSSFLRKTKEDLHEIFDALNSLPQFRQNKIESSLDVGDVNIVEKMLRFTKKIGIPEDLLQKEISELIESINKLMQAIKKAS